MMRSLSLHPLNALDASPIELIGFAGQLGVEFVCLFTNVPEAATGLYPSVGRSDIAGVRAALSDNGVRLCNLEVFPLDQDGAMDRFADGLEIGAALGASRATAHLHDIESEQQAIDRFTAFAHYAAGHGITAGLEFHNFSAVKDVSTAARIVRAAGAGALILDTLHLIRGGGDARDASAAADVIGYVQISDGPADIPPDRRWREAISERALPGDGAFPLAEILRNLPRDIPYEVEVPQSAARKAGVPAAERARQSVEALRRLLAQADAEAVA